MTNYTRTPLNFKERLSTRRDEIVLAELAHAVPSKAADMLFSARLYLHSHPYTFGTLDAIVLLFNAECCVRLESSQL
jgi:hypothetical protein